MAAATKASKAAAATQVMNMALNNMPMAKAALGEITLENWGSWTSQLIQGRYENMFYAYLTDVILQEFVSKANYENPLKRYKKGFVANGAGVRQRFIDKIDALPYQISDVEKRELKTYLASIYEADYIVNTQRYYPITLGRAEFRAAVASEQGVLDLIDTIKSMLYTSNEIDEYALTIALIQNYILSGKAYLVPVDTSLDLDSVEDDSFGVQYRAMATAMTRPSRKFNEFGVANNVPFSRQVTFLTDVTVAKYGLGTLAQAYNPGYADFVNRIESVGSFTELPFGYAELQASLPELPEITSSDLAVLKDVVGVTFDEDLIQIYDYINELWEKERAVMMDINYFLHVWQIYGISPFANIVVFVDQSAEISDPDEVTMEVVGKTVRRGRTTFNLSIKREAPSLVGGYVNLVQTDDAADAAVRIFKNGVVDMPATLTAGVTLTGEIRDTGYTATAAITPSTSVGGTITFRRNGYVPPAPPTP